MRWSKEILSRSAITGLPSLVRAGPLLFTAGCDGHRDLGGRIDPELAANAEAQCENAYGALGRLLEAAGSSLGAVVRLDHFTSSQDWLPRRQSVRQRLFGRPAPLASTGVAGKMDGLNMISAAAIAVADPAHKAVMVPGPKYGMHNISSLVRGGPLVFVSGIRGTVDPRSGRALPEETPEAFGAQTRLCYDLIRAILAEGGADPAAVVRLDSFIRDPGRAGEEAAIRSEMLPGLACAGSTVALPLSARGEVEVTALALAPGEERKVHAAPGGAGTPGVVAGGGFVFVGDCRAAAPAPDGRESQLAGALDVLEGALRNAGSALARTVRLDLYLQDVYFGPAALALLERRFAGSPPAVFMTGAEPGGRAQVALNAIAV